MILRASISIKRNIDNLNLQKLKQNMFIHALFKK